MNVFDNWEHGKNAPVLKLNCLKLKSYEFKKVF